MTKGQPQQGVYDALAFPLVVARMPVLPLSTILGVYEADDVFGALLEILRSSSVARQAVRIASPSLGDAINAWCTTGVAPKDYAPLRVLAYLARMSSRSTPFGMCAGIGEVSVGDRTTLSVNRGARRTKTRVDMGLLNDLCRDVEKGAHRGSVCYAASDAILKRGSRLYVTNVLLANWDGMAIEQRPVTLRDTPAVQLVRDLTRTPCPYDEIADKLSSTFESTIDEARRLLDALIEAGVILSELRVSPVGDPIADLFHRLGEIDESLGNRLNEISACISELDRAPLEQRDDAIYGRLTDVCRSLQSNSEHTVQIDLYAPVSGTLGKNVMRDVAILCEAYARMGVRTSLAKFRERFIRRYEGSERMVPLLELTDDNLGLGRPEAPEMLGARDVERDLLVSRLALRCLTCRYLGSRTHGGAV